MNQLEQFYSRLPEPNQSIFLYLRSYFLNSDSDFEEKWRYALPFFYYKEKPFCYLWQYKKTNIPYIGFVRGAQIDHPLLQFHGRKKMKSLDLPPDQDLPIKDIEKITEDLKGLY